MYNPYESHIFAAANPAIAEIKNDTPIKMYLLQTCFSQYATYKPSLINIVMRKEAKNIQNLTGIYR